MTSREDIAARSHCEDRGHETPCWVWDRGLDGYGYGRMRGRRAHRVSYELHVGPIPEGLDLDHLCRVRNCVNPAHLEPVTRAENVLRGVSRPAENARKTHCIHGHALTPDNVYVPPKRPGMRYCLRCRDIRNANRNRKTHA